MKPLILCTPSTVTGGLHLNMSYVEAIRQAGGTPLMMTLAEEEEELKALAEKADGFLFTGGVDWDPAIYGEEKLPECGEIDAVRDRTEMALYKAVIGTGKPIFGICRGIQSLNVAGGGKLWQDLPSQHPSQLRHAQPEPSNTETQTVTVTEGTLLARILGAGEVRVNSHHHQGVKVPAPGYIVSAVAEDGVIEGIELPSHPYCVGVQWHPERLFEVDARQNRLFVEFVEACRK